MNSIISDLDHLADDDIAGAAFLYGLRITSNLSPPSVKVGDSFAYQITANNNPSSFEAQPLPPGLQLDPATGLISGTPTFGGTYTVTVIAHGSAKDVSATVRMIVIGPTITSSLFTSVDVGQTFRYQITASQTASSYNASGLAQGLSIDSGTGVIAGSPTAVGTFNVTVIAHTSSGDAVGTVQLRVLPPRITSFSPPSGEIGGNFSYQITATGQPTSFSATGLPAGLQIDPATGIISGVPELSGSYQINVVAHTVYGDAVTTLLLSIIAVPFSDPPIARFPLGFVYGLIADPQRGRIYVSTFKKITVIDTKSLSIVKTITLSETGTAIDMSLSADGSKLWLGTRSVHLGLIDLESLTELPSFALTELVDRVREGLDGRLYVSCTSGGIAQADPESGLVHPKIHPGDHSYVSHYAIEISADRKTLYAADLSDSDTVLAKYDVATDTIAVIQDVLVSAGSGQGLSLSHDGKLICFSSGPVTAIRTTDDLTFISSTLNLGVSGGPLAFAPDDAFVFVTTRPQFSGQNKILVFDARNSQLVRTITLSETVGSSRLAVDSTNSYFFVVTDNGFTSFPDLKVYPVRNAQPVTPLPHSLLNVSTRLQSQGGDNVLIGGFIINGLAAKKVVLRAIGPSLPVPGKLADPVLELHDGTGAMIAQNDNWNAHRADTLITGLAPANEHEAAIAITLPPGRYTAVVRGLNNSNGIALVEAYDLSSDSNSKLANISTRGKVETGDNVMIGGFILGGGQPTQVVLRAIGPSLANFGVAGPLADPTLEVHDGNGALLAQDDDWRMYQEQQLTQTGLAPTEDRESAMLLLLQPGAYTAIVRGKNNGTGVGLVEVYNLDAN